MRQKKRGKNATKYFPNIFAAITIQPENTPDNESTNGAISESDSEVTRSAPDEGNLTIHADETLNSTADDSTAGSGSNSIENGTDSVTNDMSYPVNGANHNAIGTNYTNTSNNPTEIGTNSTMKDSTSTMNDAASTMIETDSNTNGTDSSYPGTNSTVAPDQNADMDKIHSEMSWKDSMVVPEEQPET